MVGKIAVSCYLMLWQIQYMMTVITEPEMVKILLTHISKESNNNHSALITVESFPKQVSSSSLRVLVVHCHCCSVLSSSSSSSCACSDGQEFACSHSARVDLSEILQRSERSFLLFLERPKQRQCKCCQDKISHTPHITLHVLSLNTLYPHTQLCAREQ